VRRAKSALPSGWAVRVQRRKESHRRGGEPPGEPKLMVNFGPAPRVCDRDPVCTCGEADLRLF
jgi:hypothetical protein